MLSFGHGDPSGCVSGSGSLCSVHGQPDFSEGGSGRSVSEGTEEGIRQSRVVGKSLRAEISASTDSILVFASLTRVPREAVEPNAQSLTASSGIYCILYLSLSSSTAAAESLLPSSLRVRRAIPRLSRTALDPPDSCFRCIAERPGQLPECLAACSTHFASSSTHWHSASQSNATSQ